MVSNTSSTTVPRRQSTTTSISLSERTLATLTGDIALPWRWGPWTVDEFGYPSQFAVSYDGDHLFGIFPFGEELFLPDTETTPIRPEELTAFCEERLEGMAPDGSNPPVVSVVEPVQFFSQQAVLSTCISPPEGPVEHAFVELFLGRGYEGPWSWIELWASNHEWDTIDARAVAAFAPVFREFVSAHSTGPASADNPPPPRSTIGTVPAKATCRNLHETGFSYREALAYWMREGLPDRMDVDRNGIPCENVYPAFVIEIVHGAPEWLPVEIVTTTAGDDATFLASGPAVESGVVCGTGTVEPFNSDAWGWTESDATMWTRAGQYVCSDGSGIFVIGHRDEMTDSQNTFGTWTIGTTGLGAYEWLSGGGTGHLVADGDRHSQDRLIGRIAIHEQG